MGKDKITYKDFLMEQMFRLGMDWEEKRKYISEYMCITTNLEILNPLQNEN